VPGTIETESQRVTAIVESARSTEVWDKRVDGWRRKQVSACVAADSAAMEAALVGGCLPGVTGAELWGSRLQLWRERGVLEREYVRRPRKTASKRKPRQLTDLQRARNLPPKVETGDELIQLGEVVWQDRQMVAKAVEMWDRGMSAGAVRQIQCSRIGWVKHCKHGHLWHRTFRCGLRFCVLCMASVYESLFYDAVERLDPIATQLVPEWPVAGHLPLRVIAKVDFTIKNDGQMPSAEKVRWFNRAIRRFFVRLARRNGWKKGDWGAAWCAEFGPGNTNLHAHSVFCGPWIEQRKREASRLWSDVVGEYAIVSVKAAKSFRHALRHAIKYPAASWKYFSASPERLASLEQAFYTVKRFHVVGAFYNPPSEVKVPPTILSPYDKCPTCGARLEELHAPRWYSLHELVRMGSRDHGAWEREQRLLGRVQTPSIQLLLPGAGPP
jgi:hypothetical protein